MTPAKISGSSEASFAFVWRPQEISPAAVALARQTSTRAILDLTGSPLVTVSPLLQSAGVSEVKVWAHDLLQPRFQSLMEQTGVKTLWVEYHPALCHLSPDSFLDALEEWPARFTLIPVTGDLPLLQRVIARDSRPPAVALKGSEAAGFASGETTNILFSVLRKNSSHGQRRLDLIIWGGIATPEAAAAFLACGARGIVFESLHWLTDLVPVEEGVRQSLAQLRPEHTTVVGAPLGVFCRVFDKGNSTAVKDITAYVKSLSDTEITDEQRRPFAARVAAALTPALEAGLSQRKLIPLGPEAAFARGFIERFGQSAAQAITSFLSEVQSLLNAQEHIAKNFLDGPGAKALGTVYPFIQGAMTWISDVPEFALAISRAGGLPTLALGLMNRGQLEPRFHQLERELAGSTYAVNLIALPENPHLDEQLAWIEEQRPPFVVIAAGEPAVAQRLHAQGLETFYIAPDEGLLRLALQGGIRWVILEGNEAGGHVGLHSTLTLAQIALDLKRRQPELFHQRHIVLAGGIFDGETALRAALLSAEAIQMGTVYLATEEIVATGALSKLYQDLILQSPPGGTAVSGESIGLRVRSLKTVKMEAISRLERGYLAGAQDEASFRQSLEALSARSLLIAARGVEGPDDLPLAEETCLAQGQFMSGAVSGLIDQPLPVAELHRQLAAGVLAPPPSLQDQPSGLAWRPVRKTSLEKERIAITGAALMNSLGNHLEEVWEGVLTGKSGIIEVPLSKWDHSLYYDPDPRATLKTYSKVAAFSNLTLSRKDLDIPPQDFRTMAHSTKLTLWLAHQAIQDAGLLEADLLRERIGIVISQNSGEIPSTLYDLLVTTYARDILLSLDGVVPFTPDLLKAAEEKLRSGRIMCDDTSLLGRLNCIAGGFIGNKYHFQGPCFAVTAACASSLVAVYQAVQIIRSGLADVMVVGGGEERLDPAHFLEFSAMKALAGVSGREVAPQESSRPFDATRDGMVLGEGGGIIILERESLARSRGARVYAYISGVGASNNDQGLVESVAETQVIALKAAFADVPYGPDTVDLVECHATSTMQGDVEEVKALKRIFPQGRRVNLASFKSQIGHTLGASGVNSLIRGVMAMRAGIIPPTLNYRNPDPEIDLESWGFVVPGEPVEWPRTNSRPRRLMANAFGFGGANLVAQVEECQDEAGVVLVSPAAGGRAPEPGPVGLEGVSFFHTHLEGQPYRVAVVADNENEARARIAVLEPLSHPLSEKAWRLLLGQGVFASPANADPLPLALVCAGQGTSYPGMGRELYETFSVIRQWLEQGAALADYPLLDLLFRGQAEDLQQTLWQQPALYVLEYAIARFLLDLGLAPAALAGHSLGELVALSLAGVFSFEDGFGIVNKRAQCMDQAAKSAPAPGTMLAVDVPLNLLEAKVAACPQVYLANFNSPRQVVVGGDTAQVLALQQELDQEGYWTRPLKVSMAFHSPLLKTIRPEMEAFLAHIPLHPPQVPVLSNTTRHPYPDDPAGIREILLAHLENPVHWQHNVEALWNDYGIRHFLEVGPKETLCDLIADTLEGARCLPTCFPEKEAATYRAALAQLYVLGHLEPPGAPAWVAFPAPAPLPQARPLSPMGGDGRLEAIVQREINAFVLESFGKFLKPAILQAIRRELQSDFREEDLEKLLGNLPGAPPVAALGSAAAMPPALDPAAYEAAARPSPPAPAPVLPAAVPPPAEGDTLEQVIRIIMEATGYEREEIEPDMDIRNDLAIRSSRLPVIIDAAERQFGISVNLEDFMGVRKVRELADRIAEVAARDGVSAPTEPSPLRAPLDTALEALAGPGEGEAPGPREPVKRLVFRQVPLGLSEPQPLEIQAGQEVAILSLGGPTPLSAQVADLLKSNWRARLLMLETAGRPLEPAQEVPPPLAQASSLAGLVLVMDQGAAALDLESVPPLLAEIFTYLKALVRLPSARFFLLLSRGLTPAQPAAVVAEGVLGMFLAAAHEYSSVLFRSVVLDQDTDLQPALTQALDADQRVVQILYRGQEPGVVEAQPEPLRGGRAPQNLINPGEVVVISGGGRGVTAYLARALAPFQPCLVLLGRSRLDLPQGYEKLLSGDLTLEDAARRLAQRQRPELKSQELKKEVSRLLPALEVARTLQELAQRGVEAAYFSCDVADPDEVARVLEQVAGQYGRIDGVLHGAGILKDSFLEFMTVQDFDAVLAVKLLGAWNLYRAAQGHGLRFMLVISSVAAVLGNVGQVNYCAANRAMSALMPLVAGDHGLVTAKTLVLPSIEGAGMADDPEMKELLKLKGLEEVYVHVQEITEMVSRELVLAEPEQDHIFWARKLPWVKTARFSLEEPQAPGKPLIAAEVAFADHELPMIHTVQGLDLKKGELVAGRTFSLDHDLWLADHKPYKILKHPLVSGVMAVETCLEAARLLYPHLTPQAVSQVEFHQILEVPPGETREASIHVCRQEPGGDEVICQVEIASPEISLSGQVLDRHRLNFKAQVVMGLKAPGFAAWPGFPIGAEDLALPGPDLGNLEQAYQEFSNLKGRYRLLTGFEGAGPGVVRGRMVYPRSDDFAGMRGVDYQYPPYVLEGLQHLVAFYWVWRHPEETRLLIPSQIGNLRFRRGCQPGETVTLEARLRFQDDRGCLWDARAVDQLGQIIMQAASLSLKWF